MSPDTKSPLSRCWVKKEQFIPGVQAIICPVPACSLAEPGDSSRGEAYVFGYTQDPYADATVRDTKELCNQRRIQESSTS